MNLKESTVDWRLPVVDNLVRICCDESSDSGICRIVSPILQIPDPKSVARQPSIEDMSWDMSVTLRIVFRSPES